MADLANSLDKLLKDPEKAALHSVKGYKNMYKKFSLEIRVEHYLELWKVLNSGSPEYGNL